MINKKSLLFLLLYLAGISLQVANFGYYSWCPNFMILSVVFIAIFEDVKISVYFGLLTGIINGFFSVLSMPMNIIFFAALPVVIHFIARMFYKHSPYVHLFVSGLAIILYAAVSSSFFSLLSGDKTPWLFLIADGWRSLILSILMAPFLFGALTRLKEKRF